MDIVTAQKLATQLQQDRRGEFSRVEVIVDATTGEIGIWGRTYTDHVTRVRLA